VTTQTEAHQSHAKVPRAFWRPPPRARSLRGSLGSRCSLRAYSEGPLRRLVQLGDVAARWPPTTRSQRRQRDRPGRVGKTLACHTNSSTGENQVHQPPCATCDACHVECAVDSSPPYPFRPGRTQLSGLRPPEACSSIVARAPCAPLAKLENHPLSAQTSQQAAAGLAVDAP